MRTNSWKSAGDPRFGALDAAKFGCVGDGVTDNLTAFADLVIRAVADGKDIYIPAGTYMVNHDSTDAVFNLTADVHVYGEGIDMTIIQYSNASPANDVVLFEVDATFSGSFRRMTLNGPATPVQTAKGILHRGTSGDLLVDNIKFFNFSDGVKVQANTTEARISHCEFGNLFSQGILTDNELTKFYVDSCIFHDIGTTTLHHGIYLHTPFTDAIISNCQFDNITGHGVHRSGGLATASGDLVISGCTFRDIDVFGIILDEETTYNALVSGCSFSNGPRGIDVNVDDAVITGCHFNVTTNAIFSNSTTKGKNLCFTGNTVNGASVGVIAAHASNTGWCISGNHFNNSSDTNNTIRFNAANSGHVISGNRFVTNDIPAIRIETSADNILIIGNYFSGASNTQGAVYIVSTANDPADILIQSNIFDLSDRSLGIEVTGPQLVDNIILAGGNPVITAGKRIFYRAVGTGNPNAAITAGLGSVFTRTDGGIGIVQYVKIEGTGNTEWRIAEASFDSNAGDFTIDDRTKVWNLTGTGQTVTLPTATGRLGLVFVIKQRGAGTGTVAAQGGEFIDGVNTYSLSAQYKYVRVVSDGGNRWLIIGQN